MQRRTSWSGMRGASVLGGHVWLDELFCKFGNFLFDKSSHAVLCEIDLGHAHAQISHYFLYAPSFDNIGIENLELAGRNPLLHRGDRAIGNILLPLNIPDSLELIG